MLGFPADPPLCFSNRGATVKLQMQAQGAEPVGYGEVCGLHNFFVHYCNAFWIVPFTFAPLTKQGVSHLRT